MRIDEEEEAPRPPLVSVRLKRKLETVSEEKSEEPKKKEKLTVKETKSQRAARLDRLMESFRLERALKGDFSEMWAPTAESIGATSTGNRDVLSEYIQNFENFDETLEGQPQEQFIEEEIEEVRQKLLQQDSDI